MTAQKIPSYAYVAADEVMALLEAEHARQEVYEMCWSDLRDWWAGKIARRIEGSGHAAAIPAERRRIDPKARKITDAVAKGMLRFTSAPVRRLYARERKAGKSAKSALTEAVKYMRSLNASAGDNGHD